MGLTVCNTSETNIVADSGRVVGDIVCVHDIYVLRPREGKTFTIEDLKIIVEFMERF